MTTTKSEVTERSSLPHYERPPLSEVAIAVQFTPLPKFLIPHVGAYWSPLSGEFPTIEHARPVATMAGGMTVDLATGLPWPRSWMISSDETRLLQIQQDRFTYNWRARDGRDYPRFDSISAEFHEKLARFDSFLREAGIGELVPTSAALSYVNHLIDGRDYQGDLSTALACFGWNPQHKKLFLGDPRSVVWSATFDLAQGGDLKAKLSHGSRVIDDKPVVVFELSAQCDFKDRGVADLGAWYDHAHEAIVRSFADLTTETAQTKVWGRHE